jgi:putative flippase GtrA
LAAIFGATNAPDTNTRSLLPPTETTIAEAPAVATHVRVWHGLRKPANWLQLIQFGLVGGSGFVLNLIVYSLILDHYGRGVYIVASFFAFCVAVSNNFFWNRLWTFRHTKDDSHAAFQAMRFFSVSSVAYLCNVGLLRLFVESLRIHPKPAQVVAVLLVMPISFLGNKLWSFR